MLSAGGLELCVEKKPNQSQSLSIKAVATITMDLLQKYDKGDGVVDIDDLDRWPIDSAFGFLATISSTRSIDVLRQVGQSVI